jgi:hypothetical protein
MNATQAELNEGLFMLATPMALKYRAQHGRKIPTA